MVVTAPPSANASADIFCTLMPTSPLASVLTDTARMAMPGLVKNSHSQRATPMSTAKQKATMRFSANVSPTISNGSAR